MTADDPSDGELVRQTLAGSAMAADRLFDRHWTRAWKAAYAVLGDPHGADDAAQRAVERAFRALDQFRLDGSFGAWISRIAANQAINALRRSRPAEPLGDGVAGPDPYAGIVERDALLGAVARLDRDRRVVVAMRYFCDLEPSEIARILEIPAGTVSSRLSRALSELREHLEVDRP